MLGTMLFSMSCYITNLRFFFLLFKPKFKVQFKFICGYGLYVYASSMSVPVAPKWLIQEWGMVSADPHKRDASRFWTVRSLEQFWAQRQKTRGIWKGQGVALSHYATDWHCYMLPNAVHREWPCVRLCILKWKENEIQKCRELQQQERASSYNRFMSFMKRYVSAYAVFNEN